MKRLNPGIILFVLFLSASSPIFGQSDVFSLFDPALKGYGGPEWHVSWVNGAFCLLGGGPFIFYPFEQTGALDIGIGGAFNYPEMDSNGLSISYGGILVNARTPVEPWLSLQYEIFAGFGSAWWSDSSGIPTGVIQYLATLEPRIVASIAVTPFFRILVGLGYRLMIPVAGNGTLTFSDLSAPTLTIGIQDGLLTSLGETQGFAINGYWWGSFATLAGESAFFDGGGTRIMLDGIWGFGICGQRLLDGMVVIGGKSINMMYGGVFAEHAWFDRASPVNLLLGLFIGLGIAGYLSGAADDYSGFVDIQPDISISLALTSWSRLFVSAGYRFALGFTGITGIPAGGLDGFTLSMRFQFGYF